MRSEHDRLTQDPATEIDLHARQDQWFVTQGSIDVFAEAARGMTDVARFHVLRLEAGEALHTLPLQWSEWSDWRLVVVRSLEGEVKGAASAQAGHEFRWLERLLGALCARAPAWPDVAVEAGIDFELAVGRSAFASGQASWFTLERGRIETTVGQLGVARGEWLPMLDEQGARHPGENSDAEPALLRALRPEELIAAPGESLFLAYRILAAALSARIAEMHAADLERLTRRGEVNQRGMVTAMRHLAALATARFRNTPRASGEAFSESLMAVLEAMGATAGLEEDRPSKAASPRAIARAAGVDLRRVSLRAGWWTRDNGPLLIEGAEAGSWSALMPVTHPLSGRTHYLRLDPHGRTTVAVDGEAARRLGGAALMVYRRLPERLRGARELMTFGLAQAHRELLAMIALGLLSALFAMALPLATALVFKEVIARSDLGQLPALLCGLVMIGLGALTFDTARALTVVRIEGHLGLSLQPALVRHLLALPANAMRREGRGTLTNRVLGIQRIMKLMSGTAIESLLAGIFSLASLILIACYSPALSALALVLVLGAGIATLLLGRRQLFHERAASRARGEEEGLFVQATEAMAKLRTTQSEPRFFALWARQFGAHKAALFRARRVANLRDILLAAYSLAAYMALYWVASGMLAHTPAQRSIYLSLGDFLAVLAAFGQLLAAAINVSQGLAAGLEAVPLYERLRPIVDTMPEPGAELSEIGRIEGAIELSHVSFRYAPEAPLILDDVSLTIEPGSLTAIVGASGSGKSTLARLLLALEKLESGDIRFQGQSIDSLDPGALRRRIGVVLQHGRLMSGTLFDNITGGLPYTLDEAWAAARLAGLARDIEAMPMGMHSVVVEGVTGLSGGQTQRVLLARAMISRPDVLLLDEATSALDNRTQSEVTTSLEALRVTRIVIAHRLSTIRNADRIHVLERGRIVESGNFASLMASGGVFATLARRQL